MRTRDQMWGYIMVQETFKGWLIRFILSFNFLLFIYIIKWFWCCILFNHYRIDSKPGSPLELLLCLCCPNLMIVGLVKPAMCRYTFFAFYFSLFPLVANFPWISACLEQAAFARAKKVYAPESTGAVLCGQKQMAEVSFKFLDSQNCYSYNNTVTVKYIFSDSLISVVFSSSKPWVLPMMAVWFVFH